MPPPKSPAETKPPPNDRNGSAVALLRGLETLFNAVADEAKEAERAGWMGSAALLAIRGLGAGSGFVADLIARGADPVREIQHLRSIVPGWNAADVSLAEHLEMRVRQGKPPSRR